MCGHEDCYAPMAPYRRWAVELFPFRKGRVSVARFLCHRKRATFSLLPEQLIPYFKYTVNAVVGTLLLGLRLREAGQQGFYGAAVEVDADSDVTPWLVCCWLSVVTGGLRHAHAVLAGWYDLGGVRSGEKGSGAVWAEWETYWIAFARGSPLGESGDVRIVVHRYAQETGLFLIGRPSQRRRRRGV